MGVGEQVPNHYIVLRKCIILIASGWKHGINLQNLYSRKTTIWPIRKNIPT